MLDAVEFQFGDIVYLRCDTDGDAGTVTGIEFRPSGHCFLVTWATRMETQHYAIELTREKNFQSA